MAIVSASWECLTSSARLQRSSQALSVVGSRAIVFGGELKPRQPIDNQVDAVELLAVRRAGSRFLLQRR
jgi:hypothetical protein